MRTVNCPILFDRSTSFMAVNQSKIYPHHDPWDPERAAVRSFMRTRVESVNGNRGGQQSRCLRG